MSFVNIAKSLGIVNEKASNFEGIVKLLTGAINLLLIPSRAIYWAWSKLFGAIESGISGFKSFTAEMPILGTAIKILLGPITLLGDAIGAVTGLLGGDNGGISAMEQYTATMHYAGQEAVKLGQANGLSAKEIKGFSQQIDMARYAGLTQAEATVKMAGDMRNYAVVARAMATVTGEVTKVVDESANALKNQTAAIKEAQFGFVGMAEGHLLQSAMDHMNAEKDRAAAVAATKKEIDDLAYVMAEGANQTDAMVMQVSASIPKITELQQSLISLKGTLINDIGGAFLDFAATAAFAFGEAINGGKNLGQVMSQLLVGLGSTIAKLAGMALLNASVALGPTPAALAMAIAGIGLIGLSGILSSVGKKDAARFDRGDNPQASTTAAIPQQSSRGLDGATGNERQPYIIQIDGPNGEILSGYMRRQMRKDDIRRG